MSTFRAFSPTHGVVVLAFVATTVGLIMLRRRLRRASPARADRLDRRLGVVAVGVWLSTTLAQFLPRFYDATGSLPLHVCDFTIIAVPAALLTCWRPARAITYFWGIGMSTQGFITPELSFGPTHVQFWVFWSTHFVIVGGALYDLVARGYRPAWKDWLLAVGAGLVYVTIILPFDLATGLNYGYVGPSSPALPSLVDKLGPWPGRVGVMLALGLAVMTLLMLPWEIARIARPRLRPPRLAGRCPECGGIPGQ